MTRQALVLFAVAGCLVLPGGATGQTVELPGTTVDLSDVAGESPYVPTSGEVVQVAGNEVGWLAGDVTWATSSTTDCASSATSDSPCSDSAPKGQGICANEVDGALSCARIISEWDNGTCEGDDCGDDVDIEGWYIDDTKCDSHEVYVNFYINEDKISTYHNNKGCGSTRQIGFREAHSSTGDISRVYIEACVDDDFGANSCTYSNIVDP